ncbi:phospho-N-acetylmuramoyl-pentapeptide-transferase [Candidatus Gottesmanbacteria bacterium]|nr:phospho-N-acetylmuramoyl-pentapeptide-transferase [Candidatus Gottesmanbacteria bacterium]
MSLLLGVLLFSWLSHSILYIPFIRLLYIWRFQRLRQRTLDVFERRTPIFDKLHRNKAGTPVGGGLLIIVLTTILFPLVMLLLHYFWVPITAVYAMWSEIKILLFTFVSFGLLGLVDDMKKTFVWLKGSDFFGLRLRHKLILEIVIASIIGFWLVHDLKIDIFYVPLVGVFHLGWWFVPFAAFVIIAFANAFNITDGLDGLASGLLMIALAAFWIISASILDTPLSLFIALWLGGVIAFLYFNIFPARIFLGDVGALSFGATLAVVGLILGKAPALMVIGGVFILEVASSLVQLLSKKFLHRKVFPVAPFHLWLQYSGWPEPKIVMRFWIISIVFALFGLWIALLTGSPIS